ncbi:acyl-CoA synthetase (AMP-forming)/AMP-acid ligase II [Roseimicrobium gellanilyticum]|uniref:Acyl-CoA synthetase (AMP-forming)/AMP-acid ligase II n=1 Tax=Roseimicrobium gellanilyticum TaxID=748857 RepID=A0A366HT10_9BACT|nr:fatty acyl-AMP ligase [Roseimicrobium gellanilyticum]RBP47421.1 acyl-CoA synthetase (AMP-forming)/AMP-acid ligase II [Roseimicrobium gellanilyticum]
MLAASHSAGPRFTPDSDRLRGIPTGAYTLVDLVQSHSAAHGEERALTFLLNGVDEAGSLTYAELDREARSIAAWLQSQALEGERALLLFPSGLEFVTAFLGCLYARVIPVPVNPPRLNRKAHRLRSIVEDAGVAVALTTMRMQERMTPVLAEAGMNTLRIVSMDARPADMGRCWQPPHLHGDSLAFLQYTSGSTSHPKGVMVSHGNLLANHRMMQEAFGQTGETRIVTWLPLFHDMGLIGNVLQALYLGTECTIMPPEVFLMKPVCWLQAMSQRRATFSGAPNFAYELCAQKVTEEQRRGLDLSGWETAFCGAEPVHHTTMERFATAFASCGFGRQALYPCYGLAEATLFVSGAGKFAGARSARFSKSELENRRVVEVTGSDSLVPSRMLVSCGHTWEQQEVVIVDPDSGVRCAQGEVGEIWISGPHVAQGYWSGGGRTTHAFDALLPDMEGTRFLRTGDLGFIHHGGLYISGRIKDLIIIAGRNHDPADIEHTVGSSHVSIRSSGCAAFQTEVEEETKLVIAVELERTIEGSPGNSVAAAQDGDIASALHDIVKNIREAVSALHDLSVHEVVLLRPAALPKTSSGKIQRHAAKAAWMERTLKLWQPRK